MKLDVNLKNVPDWSLKTTLLTDFDFKRVVMDHLVRVTENEGVYEVLDALFIAGAERSFIIMGPPQSGKSLFCQELLKRGEVQFMPYVGKNKVKPLFFTGDSLGVVLREEAKKSPGQRCFLVNKPCIQDPLGIQEMQRVEGRQVILVIDEIDKFPFHHKQSILWLQALLAHYKVVATSRSPKEVLPGSLFSSFTEICLKDFSTGSIEIIIRDFVEQFRIRHVTPLMIGVLLHLYENGDLYLCDIKEVLWEWNSCFETSCSKYVNQRSFHRYFQKYGLTRNVFQFMMDALMTEEMKNNERNKNEKYNQE